MLLSQKVSPKPLRLLTTLLLVQQALQPFYRDISSTNQVNSPPQRSARMALAPKKHGSVQMSLHWMNAICSSLLPIQIGILSRFPRDTILICKAVFRFSNGPWADTMKTPDISIQLSTSGLPRVTFECGFPESHDILQDDMIDWLMGGGGAVQAVVLVKWKPCQTTMTVRGDVELYTRDTNEVLCLQQREV